MSVISDSMSIASTKTSSSDLYSMSYLLNHIRAQRISNNKSLSPSRIIQQQSKSHSSINSPRILMNIQQKQTIISTPIHKRNQILSKSNKDTFIMDDYSNKNLHRSLYKKFYKKFIGVVIGGWLGGLFEFLTGGHNGCNNEYRGHVQCQKKYANLTIMARCINIFYTNLTLENSPFICLCRFRNNSQGKYRDCEFFHVKIQYI
ncbi:unnamed protein product [Adineta steineri]|uniref:Uncharacterized protein n=1 Tax=Adineta steineri TaxID=433720 RepID=A0A814ERC6_9BILA|nr:unnamed protein product [Adineta steineri]